MYLLDANVFIQAKNLHYGFDFVPGFWEWMIRENIAGTIASIRKVADELHAGDDNLTEWAAARGSGFFLEPDAVVMPALRRVSGWASGQNYDQEAVSKFLQGADYWLVAHALAYDHVVVTHETLSEGKQIKIPTACNGLGVRWTTPYEMLRQERARFVLAEPEAARPVTDAL